MRFRIDARHQVIAEYAHAHLGIDHERTTAHHLFGLDLGSSTQGLGDPLRQNLAIGHRRPRALSWSLQSCRVRR